MTAATGGRRVLRRRLQLVLGVTALLGLLAAVAVTLGTAPAERTFAAVSEPTQSLMSVTVPFLGVLLVGELRAPTTVSALLPTLGSALLLALAVAGFGVVVCAAMTAVASSAADRWQSAGLVVLGSLLVQGTAQLVGTGLGLLIRRPVLACLATVVLPLGLWWLLGAVAVLRPAQAWLTPYPSVQHLLSGDPTPTGWAQWLTVLVIWGIGLNTFGALRTGRSPTTARS